MTADQIEACDALWREALEAGLVQYRAGMWVANDDGDVWVCISGGDDPTWIDVCSGEHKFPEFAGDHAGEFVALTIDWGHPPNGGCLLAMAREATEDPWLHAVLSGPFMGGADWTARGRGRSVIGGIYAHTEPEALLRAILATRGER